MKRGKEKKEKIALRTEKKALKLNHFGLYTPKKMLGGALLIAIPPAVSWMIEMHNIYPCKFIMYNKVLYFRRW